MPGCALSQSLLIDCTKSYQGGVGELYIIEFDNVLSITEVSGITTAIEVAPGKQFYKYKFVKNSASFTDVFAASDNGGGGFTPTITISLKGLRPEAKQELETLSRIDSIAIVKDKNGQYLLVGYLNGLSVSAVTGQTGANSTELNGYSALTLVGSEPEFAKFVNPAIIADLLVPAS